MKVELNINKIKVRENPRKDFGNIKELADSIIEKGILEPLLVDQDNRLIVGERRLKAAKMAGFLSVPVRVIKADAMGLNEIRLIENIQRKNLNPIEEGIAFEKYINESNLSSDNLAKRIGKKKDYIERRIALTGLCSSAKEALIKRKIELGHAVVIARIDKKKQGSIVKEIIDDKISVDCISDAIEAGITKDLEDAPFDKKGCINCKFNGSEQTLLIETDSVKGKCLKPNCFIKKVNEWVKAETEKLKKKGVNVLSMEEISKRKGAVVVSRYHEEDYKKALKNLDKSDVHAVVFQQEEYDDYPRKEIYQLKKEKSEMTEKEVVKDGISLNLSRREKLNNKIGEYKRDFLIEKTGELMEKGSNQSQVMVLFALIEGAKYSNLFARKRMEEVLDSIGIKTPDWGTPKVDMEKLLKLDIELVDGTIHSLGCIALNDIYDSKNLQVIADANKINLKKHFEISDDFLKLFFKEQLVKLAKELKVDVKDLEKNSEIREKIIKDWKKGRVPRVMTR